MASVPIVETTRGQRLLRRTVNVVWGVTLVVVLLVALYVGLGRQVMANLHHFTDDLEAQLSAQLGQPVSIGQLSGDWRGLDPIVTLSGIDILQEDDNVAATLGTLTIRLDSWVSLRRLRIVFSEFSVSDADLTVVQRQDGRVGLEGIWLPDEDRNFEAAVALEESGPDLEARVAEWISDLGRLLNEPAVQLDNVNIGLAIEGQPVTYYRVPRADLVFRQGIFRASGRLQRSDSGEEVAIFSLEGRHFFTGAFDGQAFMEISSPRLFDSLVRAYQWDNLAIEGLDVDARGWLQFRDGLPVQAVAELEVPYLEVSATGQPIAPFEDLQMRAGWIREDDGWNIAISGLEYRWQGEDMLPVSGAIQSRNRRITAQLDQLDAGPLVRLMQASELLPVRAEAELAERDPRGRVRNIWFDWPADDFWQLEAELDDVALSAYGASPDVSQLNGFLALSSRDGEVILAPGPLDLGFPELFAESWSFDRFRGRISWQRRGDQWLVSADDLSSVHESQARFDGGFLLRIDPDDENILSLRVGVANGHTDLLPLFVPVHLVAEGLYDFLSYQIEDGEIPWGWYYGHGSVEPDLDYPAFTSSMQYDFQGARLRYHDDWPEVTDGRGTVQVQNAFALVDVAAARVAGTELDPGTVRVTPEEGGPRIQVDARAQMQGDLLSRRWREESPLLELAGDWLEQIDVNGELDLALGMGIYPGQDRPFALDVDAALSNVQLHHKATDLAWEALTGNVRYQSDKGFRDSVLGGRFLGAPIAVELLDDRGGLLQVRQTGRLPVADLSAALDQPLHGLHGALDYTATLRLEPELYLRLDADLEELVSDWPEPLNKPDGLPQSLTSTLRVQSDGSLRIQGNWQDRLATHLVIRDHQLDRGSLALGVRSTQLPQSEGFEVVGFLPVVDLDEWRKALTVILPEREELVDEIPEYGALTLPDWLSAVRLSTGQLRGFGHDFGALAMAAGRQNGGWELALSGDAVAGELTSGDEDGPPRLSLERLVLPVAEADTDDALESDRVLSDMTDDDSPPRGLGALTPEQRRRIPALDVEIGQLILGDQGLGAWSFLLRPEHEQGIALESLRGEVDDLAFRGSMLWSLSGPVPRTILKGSLTGGDVAGLERWFQQGVPLRSDDVRVDMDMSWRGAPDAMTLASLQGSLQFWMEDGRILEDSDAARIFRVFGLLNTDTIWRRLRLDFSDVYEAGISFDTMEGRALLTEGRLIMDPDLTIRAPSGGFRMSGETNLLEETLDMRLVVVLPVTQNLPLAAVLVGAAPVAGVLYLVDRMFGGQLSRITSATYTLGGTWQDPDVRLRNVFDTESDLRRYERPELEVDD